MSLEEVALGFLALCSFVTSVNVLRLMYRVIRLERLLEEENDES